MPDKIIWSEEKIDATAQMLVDARVSGNARETFAAPDIPPNLSIAYAVQSRGLQIWNDDLVGFKVGGIPQAFREQFTAEWLVGPVFKKNVYRVKPDEQLDFPVYEGGFAAFEPELILQIQSGVWDDHEAWTAELARDTIDRIHLGAEIAASPNINVNVLGPGSIISDFGNNAGITMGQEIAVSNLDDALAVLAETRIDGESINKCRPNPAPGGPLGALAFLLNHLRDHHALYELPDTLLVSSGAISGVHQSHVGAVGELEYTGYETQIIRLVDQSAF